MNEQPHELKVITLHFDSIVVGERMRKDLGDIPGFGEQIRDVGGLIHPLCINEKKELVAGGRRFAAFEYLRKKYPAEDKWRFVPVTLFECEGSEVKLRKLELEENLRRKAMNWKEEVLATRELYKINEREKHVNGEKWTLAMAEQALGINYVSIHNYLKIADVLDDPKHPAHKAEGPTEALRVIVQVKQEQVEREIALLTLPKESEKTVDNILAEFSPLDTPPVPGQDLIAEPPKYKHETCVACEGTGKNSKGEECLICKGGLVTAFEADQVSIPFSKMFIKGRAEQLITKLPDECVDHIHTDPPYGIDMDNLDQEGGGMVDIDKVRDTHKVKENLDLLDIMIPQFYRVLKTGGFCVIWCDEENRQFLIDRCEKAGFRVQRWSLVWCKTGPAKNQAAFSNFTKKTEIALLCAKKATLQQVMTENYFMCGPVDKILFDHPFAKPVPLLEWVFKGIAKPGQSFLDAFGGSGSIVYAGAKNGLKPLVFECEDHWYNKLVTTMRGAYETWMSPKKVKFE